MKVGYSLTRRLTVFFTLASGVVLVGLGTLVAISIDRHFVGLDRDALRDKIHLTREMIGKAKSPEDLQVRLDDVLHSHEGLYVSVLQGTQPLYSTADFQFPQDLTTRTQTARLGVASWATKDREYRGMSESVPLPGSSDPPLQIWVALDIVIPNIARALPSRTPPSWWATREPRCAVLGTDGSRVRDGGDGTVASLDRVRRTSLLLLQRQMQSTLHGSATKIPLCSDQR